MSKCQAASQATARLSHRRAERGKCHFHWHSNRTKCFLSPVRPVCQHGRGGKIPSLGQPNNRCWLLVWRRGRVQQPACIGHRLNVVQACTTGPYITTTTHNNYVEARSQDITDPDHTQTGHYIATITHIHTACRQDGRHRDTGEHSTHTLGYTRVRLHSCTNPDMPDVTCIHTDSVTQIYTQTARGGTNGQHVSGRASQKHASCNEINCRVFD